MRNYYEELYARKFENLGEMDKYLQKYNFANLNEEEAESLNRPITTDKISGRQEITKIRAKLKDIQTKRTVLRISKSRSWFFEKINKIVKPLSRLIKKNRERTQINKIRSERGEIQLIPHRYKGL